MFSTITSFFKYVFGTGNGDGDDNDDCKEDFLADQLIDLEIKAEQNEPEFGNPLKSVIPNDASCFQRTGVITYKDESCILIDGTLYFDSSATSIQLNVNDKVVYLGYTNADECVVVVRILQSLGLVWGEEYVEEDKFNVIEHVIVGQVDLRDSRFVIIKDSDLKFNLDEVEGTFVPVMGDWLELICTVQFDEKKPSNISVSQVLQVMSFKPLRTKILRSKITEWSGEDGACDRKYYFQKQAIQNNIEPQIGAYVFIEVIESNQGPFEWRAIKVVIENNTPVTNVSVDDRIDKEQHSLTIEKEQIIDVTHPLKFENVDFNNKGPTSITLTITNNSDKVHFINKWIILSKKKDSQIHITPFVSRPRKLCPKENFHLTVFCEPKFLGKTKEHLIILFRGFQVDRLIEINVVTENIAANSNAFTTNKKKSELDKINLLKQIRRNNNKQIIPGVKSHRAPNFVPVKLSIFPIPNRIWTAVLGESKETLSSSIKAYNLSRIESLLPCLSQDLNMTNYNDKWHTLMFMEEIQANINMRTYDQSKVFLVRCQEYLGLEIEGLHEKRPKITTGDKVIVEDIWKPGAPTYEGYIHTIQGNMILIKFNPLFHETYSGSDVSIQFQLNRLSYRRCHQAINSAISNLGPSILFPSRISSRACQIAPEVLETIQWHNTSLNEGQKTAICNILLGECRPMPYCIYGPPGTGKTVTVIETILQILTLIPDSRILISTPSNSAANLITERLIQYRDQFPNSLVRMVAHYLIDSDNIPSAIKPFCAFVTLGREETHKYGIQNGVRYNCKTSFVEKHRVIIGTCHCVGVLAQMGLSRGHFTHIIVDEAGQALEPEIMIPLSLTDKENGQIILAGDPMQLGPLTLSKYCKEFGMVESYLSRILDTFPYQKDYSAFQSGFNNKLVTKLNDNYRSLPEVLKLPSEIFYDATLVPKLDVKQTWINKILNAISELFEETVKTGGIYMYGIRGINLKLDDSHSLYNPQEASMVALTVCKLYKKGIDADEIGIITPYIAQTKYLRVLFDAMGLSQPKIGTVEEFQGQERPIVLISTVRTAGTCSTNDEKYLLGFVNNPKRVNVALTRAKIAALIFCDPHLLSKDVIWSKVVKYAVETDKYMGCDLPYNFNQAPNQNITKQVQ